MQHYIRKFYDANSNSEGSSGNGPSLSDIMSGGNANSGEQDLAERQQQQQAAEGTPEGVNPDGTLMEGYEKNEAGEVVKKPQQSTDPNKEEADKGDGNEGDDEPEEPDDTDESFWEDVDKLRGEPLVVEYPEGVDPLSPQGAYIREKAVEKQAFDSYEAYLKATDPRGYAYLLHRQAGGSDEDFFDKKTFSLPEYELFKENSDLQLRVYKSSLISKGLDDESAQLLVDKAVKDNKLFDAADAAYKKAKQDYEDELASYEQKSKTAEEAYKKSLGTLNQQLVTSIQEGKGLNIVIPDTEKAPFLNYVRESVEYDRSTGKFLLVQPVESDKLARQLEALYFQYKQGDLKALIQREAQTQNRKRLGKVVNRSKQEVKSEGGANKTSGGFVPLGSLFH